MNSMQLPTTLGTYIPPEIKSPLEGGRTVSGVGDNWDHNECTPDGKRTTHAMSSAILQPATSKCEFGRIKRSNERSLPDDVVQSCGLTKVVLYKNPTTRPEPVFSSTPRAEDIKPLRNNTEVQQCELIEMIYSIVCSGVFNKIAPTSERSVIPVWSAYHSMLCPPAKEKYISKVAYNPILMATPTDKSTVYTLLLQMSELPTKLGQEFDLGILSKALDKKWACNEELSSVILCDGGMHLLMAVFADIGHL